MGILAECWIAGIDYELVMGMQQQIIACLRHFTKLPKGNFANTQYVR